MLKRIGPLLIITILLFSSCATVISGAKQTIEVNPKKANSIVKVRRGLFSPNTITVEKNGDTKVLEKRFNEISTLNFILFPGWIVDLLTGAIVKYIDPETRK